MPTRFEPLAYYEQPLRESGYRLLPFRFAPFSNDEYLITNMVGEHVFADRADIEGLVRHRLDPGSEHYRRFKAKHLLIDADSESTIDLLVLKVRTRFNGLRSFTGLHIFVVTLGCEHSCSYCQVSRRVSDIERFHMSREVAERALDFTFRSPSHALKVEFQGGEPLLNFDLVKYVSRKARDRARSEGRLLQLVLATNLALLNDELLDFAREFDVYFSTSLDGPADLHDKHRRRSGKSSYALAVAGIRTIRETLGPDRVSALMTTTLESLPRVRDIIDEYVGQGFTGIFLRPVSPYGFAVRSGDHKSYALDDWLAFYSEGLAYIIELNRRGVKLVEHYASIVLRKMLTPFDTGYVDLQSPAGIGIGALVYNYNGKVYASDESRMLAEMGDETFCLGDLMADSYETVMTSDKLLNPLEQSFTGSVPMCHECVFEPFCGADPVFHHATQGNFVGHKPTSMFCNRNMGIYRQLLALMRGDRWTRNLFIQWANL